MHDPRRFEWGTLSVRISGIVGLFRACAQAARMACPLELAASIPWLTWILASMNTKLKSLLREIVPPVALRGAIALVARRRRFGNRAERPGENGSEW